MPAMQSTLKISKKASAKGECANCMKPSMEAMNVCGNCKVTQYCDRNCQAQAWKTGHKKFCVKPEDRKLSRQAALEADGVNCVICLSPEAGSFDAHWTGCHVKIHPECLVQLHVSGAAEVPNCPNCRAPLPAMQDVVTLFVERKEFKAASALLASLPIERFETGGTLFYIKYNWAVDLEQSGRLKEAAAAYLECIALDKTNANLHEHLAAVYLKTTQWKKARIHSELAIKLGSERPEPLHYVGTAQVKEFTDVHGDSVDWKPNMFKPNHPDLLAAHATYCKVIERTPEFAAGHYMRAYISFMMGDWEAAISDGRHSLSLNEDPYCRLIVGRSLQAVKRFKEAAAEIAKALKIKNCFSGVYHLAQVYYDWGDDEMRKGRPSKALFDFADDRMREVVKMSE